MRIYLLKIKKIYLGAKIKQLFLRTFHNEEVHCFSQKSAEFLITTSLAHLFPNPNLLITNCLLFGPPLIDSVIVHNKIIFVYNTLISI